MMDDRQKIEDRLRKKEQEVQGLEERLKVARTYVQALQDILKILQIPDARSLPAASLGETVPRAGSLVDQTRQIILVRGEPVHITALLDALGKDGSRESRASLTSSLGAYVRRGEIFTRPAPNTFGLVELGHKTAVGDDEEDGPPSGFGVMKRVVELPQSTPSSSPKNVVDDDIPF